MVKRMARPMFRSIVAFILIMLLLLVGFVIVSWAPDRTVAQLSEQWATPPSTFIDVNGLAVHIRDEGVRTDPTPIVLLHGTSSSLHTWDDWVNVLAQEHRVIRVDLPGFGLTGPAVDDRYDIESYVQFTTSLLDKLGIKQADLVGNSLGGYIAWKTAVDHPERVHRLVLIDSAGYPIKDPKTPVAWRLMKIPTLAPVFNYILPKSVVRNSVEQVYADPTLVTDAVVQRYYDMSLRAGNRAALAKRLTQTQGGDLAADINNIHQPTLILWGANDTILPLTDAKQFSKDIKNSTLVVLQNTGHVPQEERPSESVQFAQRFLAN